MNNEEIIARLNQLEARLKERIDSAKTTGKPWDNYLTNSPSRIVKVKIALTLAYHAGEDLDQREEYKSLLESVMDKKDWEYMRYYCADGRYQKWVSEMQAKAPEKHPVDWEYED